MNARLVVVGGGRMGEALVGGLIASSWARADEIAVVDKSPDRRQELSAVYPELVVGAVPPDSPAGWVLAVKPQDAEEACGQVSAASGATASAPLVSIVAGLRLGQLEGWLGDGVRVVRAMPNTPALVGAGASAIAGGSSASDEDMAWAESILAAVGTVHRVPEALLDAVTGLSGSGPAYVFMVAEALIEAGVLVGLPRELSRSLTVQTLVGAARMMADTGQSPADLRAAVTSPGGTTAAGLRALEDKGVRSAFLDAVVAAAKRSVELAG
ncbi:MAG: pyrroline-5-carboxylate reductase [Acidimicrobiales bacterium]